MEPIVVNESFDAEGNRLDERKEEMYVLIMKKAPGWEDWHTITITVQTDLETAKKQAEDWQEAYRENGWSEAVVKVMSATDI